MSHDDWEIIFGTPTNFWWRISGFFPGYTIFSIIPWLVVSNSFITKINFSNFTPPPKKNEIPLKKFLRY